MKKTILVVLVFLVSNAKPQPFSNNKIISDSRIDVGDLDLLSFSNGDNKYVIKKG